MKFCQSDYRLSLGRLIRSSTSAELYYQFLRDRRRRVLWHIGNLFLLFCRLPAKKWSSICNCCSDFAWH